MKSRLGEACEPLFKALLLCLLLLSSASLFALQAPPSAKGDTAAKVVRSSYGTENWDSLALADSAMRADEPLVGEKDEEPEFTRELLRVQWRESDPIDLYVIRPAHVEKPPVILYLYSYPSETRRFLDNSYCRRVTKDGYAAIGFVSALTGQRYHGRPMKQWFVSELQESMVLSVHDLQMILNYLSGRGDLDMSSVGMFGTGSGASIAILAAAVDKRIRSLDLLDPWGDWPDWMAQSSLVPEAERSQYLKPEFLKQVTPFDPVQWLPQLKTQTVRLQHVMDDSVTPPRAKQKIEAAAPHSVRLVRYDDTQHLFKTDAGGALFDWIKQQLRPASRAEGVASEGHNPKSSARPLAVGVSRRPAQEAFAN